jgi:hypothetical protein
MSMLTTIMRAVTNLADLRVITVIATAAVLLLVWQRRWLLGLLLVLSTVGTSLLVNGTKLAVQRARPRSRFDSSRPKDSRFRQFMPGRCSPCTSGWRSSSGSSPGPVGCV